MPRLQDLSKRTGVPISSLAVSFMILHELTAVLPVIGFYFLFSSLGTGLGIIQWLNRTTDTAGGHTGGVGVEHSEPTGWRGWVKGWYDEGEAKIGKVGKRYGLWQDEHEHTGSGSEVMTSGGQRAGEGVANAISAYVVVKVSEILLSNHLRMYMTLILFRKALLPIRIGVSLGAAPVFARWALEPIRNLATRWIRRK